MVLKLINATNQGAFFFDSLLTGKYYIPCVPSYHMLIQSIFLHTDFKVYLRQRCIWIIMIKFTMSSVQVIVNESLKCSSLNSTSIPQIGSIECKSIDFYPHPGHYNLVEVVLIAML